MLTNEQYSIVMDTFYLQLSYDLANDVQQRAFRLLQFFNEIAAGGFVGYNEWVLEKVDSDSYILQLIADLQTIHADEMAEVVAAYALQVQKVTQQFAVGEVNEDELETFINTANANYYMQEELFQKRVHVYMTQLYKALERKRE